jgi:hypothetical protein
MPADKTPSSFPVRIFTFFYSAAAAATVSFHSYLSSSSCSVRPKFEPLNIGQLDDDDDVDNIIAFCSQINCKVMLVRRNLSLACSMTLGGNFGCHCKLDISGNFDFIVTIHEICFDQGVIFLTFSNPHYCTVFS